MSEIIRLNAASIRARRRPWAIALLWSWEAGLALVLGSCFASVAGEAYGRHPDGDLPLFAPGGVELLDLLRQAVEARGPLVAALLATAVLARVAGLLPSAAVFAELTFVTRARRAIPLRDAVACAAGAFPAGASLEILCMATQVVTLAVGFVFGSAASSWGVPRYGEPEGDKLFLAVMLPALACAAAVGVMTDLARAAVVREGEAALDAIVTSVDVFRASPGRISWSYLWRFMVSWAPVAMGAAFTTRVAPRSLGALVLVAVVHQLIVLARVAIRTSWMARALRSIARR